MAMRNAVKAVDNNMGYSYFGARYYDSDLSVFLSVDNYSDKYPYLTPYHYCANNPLIITDPTGDTLKFADNQSVEFQQKVNDAFTELQKSDAGKEMYDNLQNSTQVFEIKEGGESMFLPRDNMENGEITPNGGEIIWSGGGELIPLQKDPKSIQSVAGKSGIFGLFHEMAHAEDQALGKFQLFSPNWHNTGLKESEWSATHRVNQIRGELGVPLRTHYKTYETSNKGAPPSLLKCSPAGISSKYVKGYYYKKF